MYNPSSATMKLTPDRYGGVVIDNSSIPETLDEFEKGLINIIAEQNDRNLLWITLPITKSNYIPLLTEHDFIFFDCTLTSLTLVKKLMVDPAIPTATNHTLGVGAYIMDQNEILVVKDRIFKSFKLPGGFIENNENISQALIREVFEETEIKVKPESIVTIWVNIDEYLNCEEVHVFNKKIVKAAMQKEGIKMEVDDSVLPVNKQYELFL